MKAIKAAYDAFATSLELIAIQNRTGISVIEAEEAAQVDAYFLSTGTDPKVLREAAVTLAKMGLTGEEDFSSMVRHWHMSKTNFLRIAMEAERYANE